MNTNLMLIEEVAVSYHFQGLWNSNFKLKVRLTDTSLRLYLQMNYQLSYLVDLLLLNIQLDKYVF